MAIQDKKIIDSIRKSNINKNHKEVIVAELRRSDDNLLTKAYKTFRIVDIGERLASHSSWFKEVKEWFWNQLE